MKICVIGASGRTGQAFTAAALSKGHQVTALVRRQPERTAERLRLAIADPTRAEDIADVISGHDAVVSCLGLRSAADAGLLAQSTAATLTAMRGSDVNRYVAVSQGLLFPSRNPVISALRLALKHHVTDSRAMEACIRDSHSDWTILRPPRLTSGSAPRGFRIAVEQQPAGSWSMSYTDLGACLLNIVENYSHIRTVVGVASA